MMYIIMDAWLYIEMTFLLVMIVCYLVSLYLNMLTCIGLLFYSHMLIKPLGSVLDYWDYDEIILVGPW